MNEVTLNPGRWSDSKWKGYLNGACNRIKRSYANLILCLLIIGLYILHFIFNEKNMKS